MDDRDNPHFIVHVGTNKFRVNFQDDKTRLQTIVDDALLEFISYNSGLDEVRRAAHCCLGFSFSIFLTVNYYSVICASEGGRTCKIAGDGC